MENLLRNSLEMLFLKDWIKQCHKVTAPVVRFINKGKGKSMMLLVTIVPIVVRQYIKHRVVKKSTLRLIAYNELFVPQYQLRHWYHCMI